MSVSSLVRVIFSPEFQKLNQELIGENQLGTHFLSCTSEILDLYTLYDGKIKICSGDKRQCLKIMFHREVLTYLTFIVIHDYDIAGKRIFQDEISIKKEDNKIIVDELLKVDYNNGMVTLSTLEGYKILESKKEYEVIKACMANLGMMKVLKYCRIHNV